MIVLDTNVLSELMKPMPSKLVVRWVDQQDPSELYISAITVAEILYGIARLPDGKRKTALLTVASDMFEQDFDGHILAFDAQAAVVYADIVSQSEGSGCQVSMADAQIAAVTQSRQGMLVTRNVNDFKSFKMEIINPWNR